MDIVSEHKRIMEKYDCGLSQVMDYQTKEENEESDHDLCPRCGGTGNELFSMYRECEACDGAGAKNPNYDYQ